VQVTQQLSTSVFRYSIGASCFMSNSSSAIRFTEFYDITIAYKSLQNWLRPRSCRQRVSLQCDCGGRAFSPDPTLFESREDGEPYSRGQWDSALTATPHAPKGDVSYVRALEPTARSGAHGFRSRRPRSLVTVLNYCRIRVSSNNSLSHRRPSSSEPAKLRCVVLTAQTMTD
jgi:hypothetical protein